eukprot:2060927-Pleurochrysis_carterae.AAC.1
MSVQPVTYPPHPRGGGGSATPSSRAAFPILSERVSSADAGDHAGEHPTAVGSPLTHPYPTPTTR